MPLAFFYILFEANISKKSKKIQLYLDLNAQKIYTARIQDEGVGM